MSSDPTRPRRNQLAALAEAIERVGRFDMPADAALSSFFREHAEMGARDRAFVSDAVFAYLRRRLLPPPKWERWRLTLLRRALTSLVRIQYL